jgi:peptidoglycan/xylan/chitin deacetylase (PgdA/CDA1 family)
MKKILLLILIMSLMAGQSVYAQGRGRFIDKYIPSATDTLTISNFDDGTWVRSAPTGDSLVFDSTRVKHGTRSIRAYCHNTDIRFQKNFGSTRINLSSYDFFILNVNIDSVTKKNLADTSAASIVVTFLINTGGFRAYVLSTNWSLANSFGDNWYSLPISKKSMLRSGAMVWDSVEYIRFQFFPPPGAIGGSNAITFDRLLACKSQTLHGGFVFSFDVNDTNIYRQAYPIFSRHNSAATLFIKRYNVSATPSTYKLTIPQINDMQAHGWDVGSYTSNVNGALRLDSVTGQGVDTAFQVTMTYNKSQHWKACRLFAWPYGAHNRTADSVAKKGGYIDYARRASSAYFAYNSSTWYTSWTVATDSLSFNLPGVQYSNAWTLAQLKGIVDSARIHNYVGSLQLEGINNTGGGTAIIDSSKLDSLLTYCDTAGIGSGTNLGYYGKYSYYLTYAPDSLLLLKSYDSASSTIMLHDSVLWPIDTGRIVCFMYNSGSWDSVAGSGWITSDTLCTLTVTGVSPKTTSYTFRQVIYNKNGTSDSTGAIFKLYGTINTYGPAVVGGILLIGMGGLAYGYRRIFRKVGR